MQQRWTAMTAEVRAVITSAAGDGDHTRETLRDKINVIATAARTDNVLLTATLF